MYSGAAIRNVLTLTLLSAFLMIAARPSHAQTETVLHNFTAGTDGSGPMYGLTSDGNGNFYGTTAYGARSGDGTVFELSPNGSGGWNETLIYSFSKLKNGVFPMSPVIFDGAGNLYGTTDQGGTDGFGVVYELTPQGTSWTETVLHSFAGGTDGADPDGVLVMDSAGNLYGTTYQGGTGNKGTVFEVSPSGGSWTEKVIYNTPNGTVTGLTMDAAGNLFGVGDSGGTGDSAVFELSPNGQGGWNPAVIYTFAGRPEAVGTLTLDSAGNLFGVTDAAAKGCGKVYKLTLQSGTWIAKTLYNFVKDSTDGCEPYSGIVFDPAGNIYGTTFKGGTTGAGTVYELKAPVGKGSYTEKVLWSFNDTDGGSAWGGLSLDGSGNLYGTTYAGGPKGDGVAFEVTP
ncbi:MAG TPA: choice-of-anchor tandem repeat GloVer-containing protein [Terriglobales bacterium]|nr:choice-of-anchor tandem repeat GloVer-containing protein [Terriglobales bacterium]